MTLRSREFSEFWGKKVLIKVTRGRDTYVGQLIREEISFIFLVNVLIPERKQKIPRLAISKKAIREVHELPGDV